MLVIRSAAERGSVNLNWLESYHSFSFGQYYDPNHMGFGALRVINEDKVQPSQGFGTHGHRDMEIVTYVLSGELEHKDSLGNGSIMRPGDVQRMTAGTGIQHSEFNHSDSQPVHLLQIWILPEVEGLTPSYEQTYFAESGKLGQWQLLGSRDGRDGSVTIHQDVTLSATRLAEGERVSYDLATGRMAWIQVATGAVKLNGQSLMAGDGVAIAQSIPLMLEGTSDGGELLLFDLAA